MKSIYILGTTEYSFMIHEMIRREGVYNVIGHVCSESQIETNRYI